LANANQARTVESVSLDNAGEIGVLSRAGEASKQEQTSPDETTEAGELSQRLIATLINKSVASALAAYLTKSRYSMM
jgi:hypothetical protein